MELTQERLRFLLNYDPATGEMNWQNPTSERVAEGSKAGALATNGRRYIALDNQRYLAHRLAWFWVNERWPVANLSAKNGNYDDLRIENYEELTPGETARRGGVRSTGKSGIRGVCWDKSRQKWLAHITHDYKYVQIGRFETKEEAQAAREKFEADLGRIPSLPPLVRQKRATHINKAARQRVLWRKTLKQTANVVGWSSFEEFAQDVGTPAPCTILVPIDTEKTLGPGNFTWKSAVKWDYSTPEGRHEYSRAHRDENRNSYRDKALRKTFGITIEDYQRMHATQDGLCACCGEPEVQRRADGKVRTLAVDHCHASGVVRDLLCGSCNKGIGHFRDDIAYLKKAIVYLEKHAAKTSTSVPASNVIPLKLKER